MPRPPTRRCCIAFAFEPERPAEDARSLAALAANPAALASLYLRYGKLVYDLALAILCCPEEAEDLTHDVFVSLCDSTCAAYDRSRGTAGAYLTTLTRSRAVDLLRRRGRSARLLGESREVPAEPAPTPFELASLRCAVDRVRAGLVALPERQRQVLELAYYHGLSQREVALALDAPVGTIKSLTRRALTKLGSALGDSV